MTQNGITFAWTLDGKGGGARISPENIAEEIRNIGTAWVHINDRGPAAREWIEKEFTYLDRIIIDALLADETHPRYLEYNNGLLLILRGVNMNPDQDPEDMVSIRIWADQHRIITVERFPVKTVREIDEKLSTGAGPKNSGDFLATLTEHLFDHLEDTSTRLHEKLDQIETCIQGKGECGSRSELMNLRRAAITLLRYVGPQRDVLGRLRYIDFEWISPALQRDFAEDTDRLTRISGDLDLLRQRAQIAADELDSLISQKVNKNLYILSTIATIFMPLTFVTGLLGMNVGGIPGANYANAFAIVTGLLIVLAVVQAILFKFLKWI